MGTQISDTQIHWDVKTDWHLSILRFIANIIILHYLWHPDPRALIKAYDARTHTHTHTHTHEQMNTGTYTSSPPTHTQTWMHMHFPDVMHPPTHTHTTNICITGVCGYIHIVSVLPGSGCQWMVLTWLWLSVNRYGSLPGSVNYFRSLQNSSCQWLWVSTWPWLSVNLYGMLPGPGCQWIIMGCYQALAVSESLWDVTRLWLSVNHYGMLPGPRCQWIIMGCYQALAVSESLWDAVNESLQVLTWL